MKSLAQYIKEACEGEACKSMKFNFDGMDDYESVLKELENIQSANVNEKEVDVVCDANIDELKKVYDILKKYSDKQRTSQHRASDEQYAQKTIKFEENVNKLAEIIDKLENPETEETPKEKEEEKDEEKK